MMNALKIIKAAADFHKTRREWLGGDGEFVDADDAQARANTCLFGNGGKRCPHNREIPLFETLTAAVAKKVIAQLKAKEQMGLKLNLESELHTCDVCLCNLKLKPWVPLQYIHNSVPIEEYPEWCWLKKELTQPKTQNDNQNQCLPE